MIRTNAEALRVFGLGYQPSFEQIKARYHELIKQAHPDETGQENEDIYAITEAYQFLLANYMPPVAGDEAISVTESVSASDGEMKQTARASKVFGAPEELRAADMRRADRSRYHRLQKQHEKHVKERKEEFERKLQEAGEQRKENEYNEAMERIRAIRAAEVTARIIEAMLYPDKQDRGES